MSKGAEGILMTKQHLALPGGQYKVASKERNGKKILKTVCGLRGSSEFKEHSETHWNKKDDWRHKSSTWVTLVQLFKNNNMTMLQEINMLGGRLSKVERLYIAIVTNIILKISLLTFCIVTS